jgi:hypothetical protein
LKFKNIKKQDLNSIGKASQYVDQQLEKPIAIPNETMEVNFKGNKFEN